MGGASLARGGSADLQSSGLNASLRNAVESWEGAPRVPRAGGTPGGPKILIDLKATSRRAERTGGSLRQLVRVRALKQVPDLWVLWDVSGSMTEYIPHFLPWMRGVVRNRPRCRVFAFGATVTDVTDALGQDDRAGLPLLNQALAWGGGTAISRAVDFVVAQEGLRPSSVTLMVSDGWEAEAPDRLAGALVRLKQKTGRLVWVNPLASTPGYRPVQRGIQVAMRYSDIMASGTYERLQQLGRQVGR